METRRLPLAISVAWHPSFEEGEGIAAHIRKHFRRSLFANVTAGQGVSVTYRTGQPRGGPMLLDADWEDAGVSVVVALIDSRLRDDATMWARVCELSGSANGRDQLFLPVAIDSAGIDKDVKQQAVRWDRWRASVPDKMRLLLLDLTHEIARLLQARCNGTKADGGVQVFLSHSKHDETGETVALEIRDWLHENSRLTSFLDVKDIPSGADSSGVLLDQIKVSAMLAVHTDSYSTREWCRREVLEAKRHGIPMVVADCLLDRDDMAIPHMGNVPIVRVDPGQGGRIEVVVQCLLDEVLSFLMWRFLVSRRRAEESDVLFFPRSPELVTLATLPPGVRKAGLTIVHPGPPLSPVEEEVLSALVPGVRTPTFTDWREGIQ